MSFVSILFFNCLLYYIMTILTQFFAIFVAFLIPGARSSGSIGHKYLSHKRKRNLMNGGRQGC